MMQESVLQAEDVSLDTCRHCLSVPGDRMKSHACAVLLQTAYARWRSSGALQRLTLLADRSP